MASYVWTRLPAKDYTALSLVDGRLVVTGNGFSLWSRIDPLLYHPCFSATIDPSSMRILATRRGNCDDPRMYGRNVVPVADQIGSGPEGLSRTLQISVVATRKRAGYRVGPVVLRYTEPDEPSNDIAWTYGDGYLWVYAAFVGSQAAGYHGEVLRLSEHTGRVLERWRMPSFSPAILAADDDGLWVTSSWYPAAQQRPGGGQPGDVSLYRVAPDRPGVSRALALPNSGASWVVASDHSVWLDVPYKDGAASRLWRLDGADGSVPIRGRDLTVGEFCGGYFPNQSAVAGTLPTGILAAGCGGQLISYDAFTGDEHVLSPRSKVLPGPEVAVGRSVFELSNAATRASGELVRITPTARTRS